MNSFIFTVKNQTALENLIGALIPEDVDMVNDFVTTSTGKKYMIIETKLTQLDIRQIHRDMISRDDVSFLELP